MAKSWARSFYNSQAWKQTRRDVYERDHGLCRECAKRGIITAAEIVHHIQHLTPANIHDTNITLNHNNLVSLCRECHARVHGYVKSATRDGFYFDAEGNLRHETDTGEGLS